MLFHPFEEQLDLPALLVQQRYFEGVQIGVVGQENELPAGLGISIFDAPHLFRIALFRIMALEPSYLVVLDAFRPVRRSGVHSLEAHVRLGTCDEKRLLHVDGIKTGEVDVRLVHHVKTAGLVGQDIQYVHIVKARSGNMDEARYRRPYVVKRMELDTSLGLPELRPPEYAQAKVYGAGVKGVNVALEIDLEIVTVTTFPCLAYQYVGELLENLMAPFLVSGSQVTPRNGGPEAKVVVFGTVRLKAQHKVAHTVPRGKLAEDHAKHLVPTGKALDISIALMGLDDTVEDPAGKELGYLGEDIFTSVHGFFVKIHIPI